jgi:hypothetical protein
MAAILWGPTRKREAPKQEGTLDVLGAADGATSGDLTSIILESRRIDGLSGSESAFLRLFPDEDRVVGHFVEGPLHPSFGFKVTVEHFKGILELVLTLPKCKHERGTDHLFTFGVIEITGKTHNRTFYCIPSGQQDNPNHRELIEWLDQMFAKGRDNLHPGPAVPPL